MSKRDRNSQSPASVTPAHRCRRSWALNSIRLLSGIFCLTLLCPVGIKALAEETARTVTFDDLQRLNDMKRNYVSTIDISSDGRQLAVGSADGIEILDAISGKLLHKLGEGQLPRWSPNGTMAAFYSTRSGTLQLWLWHAASGQVAQLTRLKDGIDPNPLTRMAGYLIDAFDYSWAPDSRSIVFASRIAQVAPARGGHSPLILDGESDPDLTLRDVFAHPSAWTAGEPYSPDGRQLKFRRAAIDTTLASRLQLVDLATGESSVITTPVGTVFHPVWSPNGRFIAYADMQTENPAVGGQGRVVVQDIVTGDTRIIASSSSTSYWPRWSADGRQIAFLEGDFGTAPTVVVVNVASKHILRFPIGKQVLKIDWSKQGDELLMSYLQDGRGRLSRMRLPAGDLHLVATNVQIAWVEKPDGSVHWREGAIGERLWWRTRHDRIARPAGVLSRENVLAGRNLGRTERLSYRTAKGVALQGALLFPPNYRVGQRYPLIVDAYPFSASDDWTYPMAGNYAWAAAGYIVFKPYIRAPNAVANCSGDRAFCEAARGPEGWDTATDDVLSGIDAILRRGLVDPNRMCIYGHSNGGGVAANLITKTDRFRCAVIVAPALPNWIGAPLLASSTWQTLTDWAGATPLDDPNRFVALSAAFRAKQVKSRVLLAAGDNDGMFLLGAIEMYNALRYAKADVQLLRYPEQDHVFEADGLRDLWQREMSFFGENLLAADGKPH